MMKRILFIVLCVCFLPSLMAAGAYAAPPKPQNKTKTLETVKKKLESEKEQERALQQQLQAAKTELENTQQRLVTVTEEARENERRLDELERRIDKLSRDETKITERLEQDYGTIADVILALERMRRIPPEALIVRPGTPLETAQTAMLLQSTLPAVHKRAETLSNDLRRLQEIEQQLEKDRAESLYNKKQLDQKRMVIAGLTVTRKELYKKTQKDHEQTRKRIEKLSREAKSLQDLMQKLAQERQDQRMAGLRPGRKPRSAPGYEAAMPAPGTPRLPVTGFIRTNFGENDQIGAVSEGVTIESRPGSVVVAPMSGIVRFANNFRNYGNMMIIEHRNGYHSLVAGFARIDTVVGQSVKAGEPVGILPITSSRGGRPALYYELRQKGKAISPARLFNELKS